MAEGVSGGFAPLRIVGTERGRECGGMVAIVTRVAQYAGDIRIVIYLFYYPYFIMTPGPCGLRTTTSEDDNL